MGVNIREFSRPATVDNTAMQKTMVRTYRDERHRRARTVDDEYRDDIPTNLPCGEFSLSNVSAHKTWQEEYCDRFGKFIPLNSSYRCSHCGTLFSMGYPPEVCPICGTITPFGELVEGNYFNK